MTSVIICGGRDYTNATQAFAWFDAIHAILPITQVIEGGARGGDHLGKWWANRNQIPVLSMPANWDLYGKSAGYKRNVAMASTLSYTDKEGFVIALPGGRGTQHMIDIARKHGISVIQPALEGVLS